MSEGYMYIILYSGYYKGRWHIMYMVYISPLIVYIKIKLKSYGFKVPCFLNCTLEHYVLKIAQNPVNNKKKTSKNIRLLIELK